MIKFVLLAITVLVPLSAFAADSLVYSIQQDDQERILVDIQNRCDRVLILHSFVIVFHSGSGKSKHQVICKEDCRLVPGKSKKFGPFTRPAGTTYVEVADMEYSTES